MPNPTQLATQIATSPTIAMNDKAKQLAAEGHSVIGLAGGEPDFDTPPHIVEAAIKAIRDGETRYAAPSKGIRPLLEAIAVKMEADNHVSVDPLSGVIVTPGGKLALFLALKAMLDPGDEVLIPAPYWVSYPSIATMVGGVPVTVETSSADNYRLRLEHLREHISAAKQSADRQLALQPDGTHAVFGRNRSGRHAGAGRRFVHHLRRDLREAQFRRSAGGVAGLHPRNLADRVIVINGMSKAYAMTGWRLGWLAGPSELIGVAGKFNSQTATSAATFTQIAAVAALTGPQDCVEAMRQVVSRAARLHGSTRSTASRICRIRQLKAPSTPSPKLTRPPNRAKKSPISSWTRRSWWACPAAPSAITQGRAYPLLLR